MKVKKNSSWAGNRSEYGVCVWLFARPLRLLPTFSLLRRKTANGWPTNPRIAAVDRFPGGEVSGPGEGDKTLPAADANRGRALRIGFVGKNGPVRLPQESVFGFFFGALFHFFSRRLRIQGWIR